MKTLDTVETEKFKRFAISFRVGNLLSVNNMAKLRQLLKNRTIGCVTISIGCVNKFLALRDAPVHQIQNNYVNLGKEQEIVFIFLITNTCSLFIF